jgi:hypothetical protein
MVYEQKNSHDRGYEMFRKYTGSIIAAGIILLGGLLTSANSETINFVWEGKDFNVPGSMASGQTWMKVEYPVEKGKGVVSIARRGAKKTDAVIVLASNPTRSAQIAAEELNHYLEKMTGLELPVVTDESRPVKGPKILIGESKLTKALGLKNSDFDEQEYCISTYGNILVLMGYDEQEYGLIDYEGNGLWHGFTITYNWSLKPEISKKVGSVYAVDTFLQKFCGVRWYMPGELGEVYPEKESIVVKDIDIRLKPWSVWRSLYPSGILDYFNFSGSGKKPVRLSTRDVNLWYLRMKLIGIEAYNANHSLIAAWFEKRFPDKKEILAKGYEHPTQLCLEDPELLKIVCKDADDYFAGKTNYERSYGDYFCVMPHDTSEYCKCSKCQALIKKEKSGYGFWNDKASNYTWGFVNRVAKYLQRKHPGKWVSCCSYANYSMVPDKVELADNVAVEVCRVLIEGIKEPEYKKFYRQLFKDWAKAAKRWYVWEYFDHIQGNYMGSNFPGIFLHEISEDIRFLKENGCRGLFNELSSDKGNVPNIAQDHLNLYVQLQLLNDSSLNVDEMLDEYCKLFYGPAYEPMKSFFMKMEERFSNPDNWKLNESQTDANWDVICPVTELRKFEELINKASLMAVEKPYSTRVRLIKEAVYRMMEKNCMKHFIIMKSAKRVLSVPYVKSEENLLKGGENHVEKFFSINGDPTETLTEAWAGYDNKNFHVKVKCYEEDMSKLKAVIKPDDKEKLHICGDDSIELFIDVGRTRKDYYQILGNTNQAINDQKRFGRNSDFSYSTGTSCSVEKAKDYWTIDFTVPLENLTGGKQVKKGDIWGFNICRNRIRKGLPSSIAWTAWCPTGLGFHVPERFGTIEFE